MRAVPALCLALCVGLSSAALARPYTIEDLLTTESLGQLQFDPAERWLVIEHRRPWKSAAMFDLNIDPNARLSRLELVDLDHPGPARPLFDQTPDAGYRAGPISPDGARMLVYRLKAHSFEAGVATLATRRVRWLGITPEQPIYGRAAEWRSAEDLVLVGRADGDVPRTLAIGWKAGQRLATAQADTAAGQVPARTRLGSGRFLGVKARAAPSRLISVNARSWATRVLAEGAFVDLELSADGRYAAALEDRDDLQPMASDRAYIAFPTRRRRLVIADLETGRVSSPCAERDIGLHLLTWAPDRPELLLTLRRPDLAWDARDLARVDAPAEACQPVDLKGLSLSLAYTGEDAPLPRADWMGSDPIAYAQARGSNRPDWYRLSASGPVNLTARLPAPPRAVAAIAADHLDLDAEGTRWRLDRDGQDVAGPTPSIASLAGGVRERTRLRENPTRPPGVTPQQPAPAQRPSLPQGAEVLAAGRTHVAGLIRSDTGQARLVLAERDKPPVTLLTLNDGLADVTPPDVLPIRHGGPQGEALTSWLYRPAGRPSTEALPLVVIPYRGMTFPAPPRRYALGEVNTYANLQLLVAAGYAVLVPSLPYDQAKGEPTANMAHDILLAVDAALAQGGLDPDRIALFGHSFGALSAVAAATQSDRFKTVIASAGTHDEITNWAVFPLHQWLVPEDGYAQIYTAGGVESAQAHMGAPPWADPQRYLRNSNLFSADKITAPVLILHGQSDELSVLEGQELFTALYRQGKDAMFVTYWGEGHTLNSPANIRDMYATILDWLAKTLPPPRAAASPTRPAPTPPR